MWLEWRGGGGGGLKGEGEVGKIEREIYKVSEAEKERQSQIEIQRQCQRDRAGDSEKE